MRSHIRLLLKFLSSSSVSSAQKCKIKERCFWSFQSWKTKMLRTQWFIHFNHKYCIYHTRLLLIFLKLQAWNLRILYFVQICRLILIRDWINVGRNLPIPRNKAFKTIQKVHISNIDRGWTAWTLQKRWWMVSKDEGTLLEYVSAQRLFRTRWKI